MSRWPAIWLSGRPVEPVMLLPLCMLGCYSTEMRVCFISGAQHTCPPLSLPLSLSLSHSRVSVTCWAQRRKECDVGWVNCICLVFFHLLLYESMATHSVKLRGRRLYDCGFLYIPVCLCTPVFVLLRVLILNSDILDVVLCCCECVYIYHC